MGLSDRVLSRALRWPACTAATGRAYLRLHQQSPRGEHTRTSWGRTCASTARREKRRPRPAWVVAAGCFPGQAEPFPRCTGLARGVGKVLGRFDAVLRKGEPHTGPRVSPPRGREGGRAPEVARWHSEGGCTARCYHQRPSTQQRNQIPHQIPLQPWVRPLL